MTPEARDLIVKKLVAQQVVLRDVFEHCETQAELCDSVGAKGLAFAISMVRESLISYSKELNTFVLKFIADEPFEEEEFPLDT